MTTKAVILSIFAATIISSGTTAYLLKPDVKVIEPSKSEFENLEAQLQEMQIHLAALQADNANSLPQAQASLTTANNLIENEREQPEQILAEDTNSETAPDNFEQRRQQQINEWIKQQQSDYRRQALIKAGFAQEDAARILQLESKVELDQLNAQYQYRRQRAQRSEENGQARPNNPNPIRAELGDENYERYLRANGSPTTAQIGSIIEGSPGDNAGLLAGDSIVSYDGQRVFSLRDVNELTVQGNIGESVLIEVDRQGQPVQITIPRGPIGVNNGQRGFR